MRVQKSFSFVGVLFSLLFFSLAATAAVIRVPGDQPNIQAGISAAGSGDTVLVADGTWTGNGNKNLDLQGKAIIVRSAGGPAGCIIDCQGSGRGFHVHRQETLDTVIRGFTIQNGDAAEGGGILCEDALPTIDANIIRWCTAESGGGICCAGSPGALILGNTITGCTASTGYGGGFYSRQISLTNLSGNLISDNQAVNGGGVACSDGSWLILLSNTIRGNTSTAHGGGVYGFRGYLLRNTVEENVAGGAGGGIIFLNDTATVLLSTIRDNEAQLGGGLALLGCNENHVYFNRFIGNQGDSGAGICIYDSSVTAISNLFSGNQAPTQGGGIWLSGGSIGLRNDTLQGNTAGSIGGGIYATDSTVRGGNCIIWRNTAPVSSQVYQTAGSTAEFDYSDIQGGWQGTANLDTNPLFVTGPLGDFYLSQQAAGQAEDSPCLDAGDPNVPMSWGTTRTDCMLDEGLADIGAHFRSSGLVAGPGPGYGNPPRVRLFPPVQDAEPVFEFNAYGAPHYGVNLIGGDLDGDEFTGELLTGAGPGDIYGPHVRGFDLSGNPLPGLSFIAYGTQKYGVNVACGNLDDDTSMEIVTGAGPGAVFGPHVRAFDYDSAAGAVSPLPGVSYFAYGTLKWGVNVACGNLDMSGEEEIVTGAGPGAVFGPHVRGWKVENGSVFPIPAVSFLAYGTQKWGVNVTCGDVDGDGLDEIITAPGPSASFGAQVRGWNYDGAFVSPLPGLDFFAWPSSEARYGAKVSAGADQDGDGRAEVVVGQGPGPALGSQVKVFRYDGTTVNLWYSLQAFPEGWSHGVNAAGWQHHLDIPFI